jgi:hypothetical protein
MPRLTKIALSTVLGFFGALLAVFGARFWFAAHRTVSTIFDSSPRGSDPDAMRIDNADPWIDKGFILHRITAVVVLLVGLALLVWAVSLIRAKREHDLAT